jgi:hypothetical protein
MVSAFAARQRLVLAQTKVDEKSNEILAIPALLDMLSIEGAIANQTVDGDHGRIETRRAIVIHDVAWLQERRDWPGLKGVIVIESVRDCGRHFRHEHRETAIANDRNRLSAG